SRRILHQPFLAEEAPPTYAPPAPELPFSSSASDNAPFFPAYPSPPPPESGDNYASYPANISSLTSPHSQSKSTPPKLIAAAVAAVVAAVVILGVAVFLHLRRRSRTARSPSEDQVKNQRSEGNSTVTGSHRPPDRQRIPKLPRPSPTSSELLYLGTLVNPRGGGGGTAYGGGSSSVSDDSISRRMESPELQPLPPLNAQQSCRRNFRNNAEAASSKDDEDEVFYSPRGSLSAIGTGSASRRAFTSVRVENFDACSSNSSSIYSSTTSGSVSGGSREERSGSLSLSPENLRNLMPKSPDLIEIQNIAPPPQHRLMTLPREMMESVSPSPPSSSSPGIFSGGSEESSPRISSSSDQNLKSPVRITFPSNATPTKGNSPVSSSPSPQVVLASPPAIPVVPPPPPPPPLPEKLLMMVPRGFPTQPKSSSSAAEIPVPVFPAKLFIDASGPVENNVSRESAINGMDLTGDAPQEADDEYTTKPKLKPLHWDKVRASSNRKMVWDQLKSSSFKLNEEMIETLFVADAPKPTPKEPTRWQVIPTPGPESGNRVLDPKKAQNIAILLKALNVTVEEVCEGLLEGNSEILGTEFLESLLKMAPTKDEERKLREYEDHSPRRLGAAERFLKTVLEIPFAFKRAEAMLYVSNFESEVDYLRKSCATLEVACEELRTSRMFIKILEAVLKTGNRMNVGTNRGDAHAFKLDTLLKLVDVKGADGKTTLLHFVVQEIIKSEGARVSSTENHSAIHDDARCRKLGLRVVSCLCSELSNVKKAATMDSEVLAADLSKLSRGIGKIQDVVKLIISSDENNSSQHDKFCESMQTFMKKAEGDIIKIQAQESVALSLVKEITEYFHGNSAKEEAHPFRIFMVVRDFLTILDRVCKEVGLANERTVIISSAHRFPIPVNPMLHQIPPMGGRRMQHHSSGEDS
ncbi:hypothetical protein M569_06587, partial [Genlisea aurea]